MNQRQFRIDLHAAHDFPAFAAAFNNGLIHGVGGHWAGQSWDAFDDYLSWPTEETYELVLDGWWQCSGLSEKETQILEAIFASNPHVLVTKK